MDEKKIRDQIIAKNTRLFPSDSKEALYFVRQACALFSQLNQNTIKLKNRLPEINCYCCFGRPMYDIKDLKPRAIYIEILGKEQPLTIWFDENGFDINENGHVERRVENGLHTYHFSTYGELVEAMEEAINELPEITYVVEYSDKSVEAA